MIDQVKNILEKCGYKGLFVKIIKHAGLWEDIEHACSQYDNLTDVEKVYLYMHPKTDIICDGGYQKRYLGLTRGYNDYCKNNFCEACKANKSLANKSAILSKYGVDNVGKLPKAIENRNNFWSNNDAITAASNKRKKTNIEKYGTECVFQNEDIKSKIKETIVTNYGVDNPSKSDIIKDKKIQTCLKNHGVANPNQSTEIKQQKLQTSIERYGVEYPMQLSEVKDKMMKTKIENGSFAKSNSSNEATLFFRKYVNQNGYDLSQVAFDDTENNMHEWGYYFDRWYLYDFVAFEKGHRGDSTKILEIVEYHGPFHYTIEDANARGNDMAYPWKSKSITIMESYKNDCKKEQFARDNLTKNYNIIWAEKWHKK